MATKLQNIEDKMQEKKWLRHTIIWCPTCTYMEETGIELCRFTIWSAFDGMFDKYCKRVWPRCSFEYHAFVLKIIYANISPLPHWLHWPCSMVNYTLGDWLLCICPEIKRPERNIQIKLLVLEGISILLCYWLNVVWGSWCVW